MISSWPLFVIGAVVIGATLIDLAWTAIAASGGAGPLSRAVTRGVWGAVTVGAPSVGRRQVAGYIAVIALPAAWVVLLLLGFTLLYVAGEHPIVDANKPGSVGLVATVAYAAGGLAGAGAGFTAASGFWELVNNVSALVGLATFTLAITFIFRVVTADAQARSAAWTVAGLGNDPYEVVSNALAESGGDTLSQQVVSASQALSQVAQQHLALPVLRYLQPTQKQASIARSAVLLDEVLTILDAGVRERRPLLVASGRSAVTEFVQTLGVHPTGGAPPRLTLGPLHQHRDKLTDDDQFEDHVTDLDGRRRTLTAVLHYACWCWSDVHPEEGQDGDGDER